MKNIILAYPALKKPAFKRVVAISWVCVLVAVSQWVSAHGRWILPSHTILSGDAQFVTVDFSISNDIFHPDIAMGGSSAETQAPMASPLGQLTLISPKGEKITGINVVNLARKSSAALTLNQSGTYRLRAVQPPVFLTFFTHKDGGPGRQFGQYRQIKSQIPNDVSDIYTLKLHHSLETYMSLNDTNREALQPVGEGLELKSNTHPNELFAGEAAQMQLLLHGKPAPAGIAVHFIRGGTRFRNARDSLEFITDGTGSITVSWEEAGMYLLEAEHIIDVANGDGYDKEGFALFVTLEVNPE